MILWVNHFFSIVWKKRLSHNSYAYLHLDKDRASQCQNLFHNFVLRKPFSLRQDLFFVLVLSLSVLIIAHFYCETHFLILAVQAIKIISRSFSLFCFSQDLQLQNKLQSSLRKLLSLQILLLEKLENKYTTWLFNFKTSPLKCLFLNNHQIYTQKPFRGKELPVH